MTVYVVSMMKIHDPETYRKYTALSPPILKRHGGRFLTRGTEVSTLEGETYIDRMVILEFPSKDAASSFFKDPDYVAAMKFRHDSSNARILLQEGGPETENPDPLV